MLSLLSIIMVVLAATVDATPGRTKMVDGKPRSRLGKVHNHLVEAQSETFLAIVTATGATTARGVLPYTPPTIEAEEGSIPVSGMRAPGSAVRLPYCGK